MNTEAKNPLNGNYVKGIKNKDQKFRIIVKRKRQHKREQNETIYQTAASYSLAFDVGTIGIYVPKGP